MNSAEYIEEARKLRQNPMVKAWIAAYQKDIWTAHKDCQHCGFPHSPHVLCGGQFGELKLGRDTYSIDFSNLVWFFEFMTELGQGLGFHWRDEVFFTRGDEGGIEIRYIEQFNNTPQIKTWRIPPAEWASIVCSVSKEGETGARWDQAQDFHGRS